MSSSGGGGGGLGGFAGGPDGDLDCDIVETTSLLSPDPTILQSLKAGDILDVQLRPVAGRDSIVGVKSGQPAGGIAFSSIARTRALIQCIRRGNEYDAIVLSVRGGLCTVEVHPRP